MLSFARTDRNRAGHVCGPQAGLKPSVIPSATRQGVDDDQRFVTSTLTLTAAVSTRSGCVAVEGKWIAYRAGLSLQRTLGQTSRHGRLLELEATAGLKSGENVIWSH